MRNTPMLLLFTSLLVFTLGCSPTEPYKSIDTEELTINAIHEAYTNGSYDCQELVSAYIDKINANDDIINAITTINPLAMDQAKMLDEEYKKTGVLRPLHGIPILVKDNINTKGLPTTAGAFALADFIPETDAFIMKKLIDAGAVIIAKTNMAEWAFSAMHTNSSTGGTTRNPYNIDHVPAGSSGGTGASVAANFGAIGLGTDTGNSIRGPSSHNALVGFRSTLGLISRSGIVPLYLRNDVVGPMCRTVEDATRVMEVMVGVDPSDPITAHSKGRSVKNYQQFLDVNGLNNSRIGVLRELSEDNPDPEIKQLFGQALVDLEKLGAELIDPVVIPNFAALRQNQWCSDFRKDVEAFLADHVKRDTMQSLEDIIRVGTTAPFSESRLRSSASKNDRWGDNPTPCDDAYTDALRIAFREAIEKVMDSLELDAIVYPTWNNKPASIDQYDEEYLGDNNQIIAPHTGQPAFTVPMGYSSENLPAGLQFLGRMYDEPTLIKLAYSYEQGTKHRVPPVLKPVIADTD